MYVEIDSENLDSKFKVTQIKLELSGIVLTGEIPKEIGKLTNLEKFVIY